MTLKREDVSNEQILKALDDNAGNKTHAAKDIGTSRQLLTYWIENDDELNVRMMVIAKAKQLQRAQDTNRIERKAFREFARFENAVGAICTDIRSLLRKYRPHLGTVKHKSKKNSAVGVIQFSDIHFNECVMIESNTYDFTVASKRIKKHVDAAMKYFETADVQNVLVALTGDMLNSDRRLDELLQNSTNRARAVFLAVDIMQQAIRHLNQKYNVSVASITGNESRIPDDIGWVDSIASDNYDYIINGMLDAMLSGSPGIRFISGDPTELVVNVAGMHLLILHGHGAAGKKADFAGSMQKVVGRYAANGIKIDFILSGHTHETCIADRFARSASVVGANDYSEKALNLSGRASQNCFLFYPNGSIDAMKVDLQNVDKLSGYPFNKDLEAYNAKSASKINDGNGVEIFKIVV